MGQLNKNHHHAKFHIYPIHGVQENLNIKFFATCTQLTSKLANTDHYIHPYFSCQCESKTTTTTTLKTVLFSEFMIYLNNVNIIKATESGLDG